MIKEIQVSGFGKCLLISNDTYSAAVTLDIGPRILRFHLNEHENLFKEDINRNVFHTDEGKTWFLYGGHRLWASPELSPRTYFPDNFPVEYRIEDKSIRFIQIPQTENGLQFEILLTPHEDALIVEHSIINIGESPQTLASWALSAMSQGGAEIVPVCSEKTGFLPNRILSLWDYTNLRDERVFFGKKYIVLRQDSNNRNPFKIGFNNTDGWAAYINHGQIMIKRFEPQTQFDYPDFGAGYETYTNHEFLEIETLSRLRTLEKGQAVTHTERWQIKPFAGLLNLTDEEEIEMAVTKLINE